MRSEQDARQLSSPQSEPQRISLAVSSNRASKATEPPQPFLAGKQALADVVRKLKARASRDLLLLIISAALLPALLIIPVAHVRIPLGLVLVLFAPGYALVAALFPRRDDANGVTRAGLSFGLSIALMPSIVLVLELISISLTPLPLMVSLSLWITFWASIALWRRRALPVEELASIPFIDLPASRGASLLRSLPPRTIVFCACAVAIMLSMILLLATDSQQASTEFYVLGAKGEARDYPREVVVGESVSVALGIMNLEATAHQYRVYVWASDLATPDDRTLVSVSGPIVAEPAEPFRETITWRMPEVGDDKTVHFLLYRDEDSELHRSLQLSLNVREPGPTAP